MELPSEESVNTLAQAIRGGFSDLGDRIAQGTNPENVAMSFNAIAESLGEANVHETNIIAQIDALRDEVRVQLDEVRSEIKRAGG